MGDRNETGAPGWERFPASPEPSGGPAFETTGEGGRDRAGERFWEVFEEAPLDDRLAIVHRLLDGEDEVPGEQLFEMAVRLVGPLRAAERIGDLEALLDRIEEEGGEEVAGEAWWFLLVRAENALLDNRDAFTRAFDAWIMVAHEHLLEWILFLDRCRYHEVVEDAALSALEFYREHREAEGLTEALREKFAETTLQLLLTDYRSRLAAGDADRYDLSEDLEVFEDPPEKRATLLLRDSPEPGGDSWEVSDFSLAENGFDAVQGCLVELTFAFSEWLREEHGWGLHRAELARGELEGYLLTPGDEVDEEEEEDLPAEDLLLPGAEFAEEYLRAGADPLSPEPHRVAALFQALEVWPDFLVAQGLLEPGGIEEYRGEFREALEGFPQELTSLAEDPRLFAPGS